VLQEHDLSVEIIHLSQINLQPCRGCAGCVERGYRCKTQDDVESLLNKIRQADGVILASPVYMWQISTPMKTLFDRLVSYFHRPDPQLVGKPVFVMTTSASPMVTGPVVRHMSDIAHHLGMRPCGKLCQLGANPKPVSTKPFGKFLRMLNSSTAEHRPSLKELFNFFLQQGSAMTFLPEDGKYFVEHGWDHGLYYYPCRINIFKRAAIGLLKLMGGAFANSLTAKDNS